MGTLTFSPFSKSNDAKGTLRLFSVLWYARGRMKSVKLYWDEREIAKGSIMSLIFGQRKETVDAALLLIRKMKENQDTKLSMTRKQLRVFAEQLQTGEFGVKYSYHNFYTKLLRKLLVLGFIEKDVPAWNDRLKRTQPVYQLKIQIIPARANTSGFAKYAWQICNAWNELISIDEAGPAPV